MHFTLTISMHPFTQEKRRKINLGGATSVASQTDILHSAKARRTEREEIRRRHESAVCIQSRWRSFQHYRAVRQRLSQMFQEDVLGLNGMRALVLIGNDDLLLAQWSEAAIRAGDGESSVTQSTILCDPPTELAVALYPATLFKCFSAVFRHNSVSYMLTTLQAGPYIMSLAQILSIGSFCSGSSLFFSFAL